MYMHRYTHTHTHTIFFSYMPGNLEEIQNFKGEDGEILTEVRTDLIIRLSSQFSFEWWLFGVLLLRKKIMI